MADEITPTETAPEAPVVAEAVTPETPAPSISEAAPAVAPESPAPEAKAEPVPAPEATDTPAPETAAKEPASLLSDAVPAPEVKTDQTAEKPEEVKDAAPAPEEARAEEAPLPEYDVFTVPEGVELEDAQVDKYVGILGSTERAILNAGNDPAKIHAAVQDLGQKMLDQYTEEIAGLGERIAQVNAETFNRTQEHWKSEFFNDPEIGGNRKDTTLQACGSVINRFGGTPQQIAEVRQVLSATGAGNTLPLIRLLNNFATFLGEGTPVPGEKPEPQSQTHQERRYGKR